MHIPEGVVTDGQSPWRPSQCSPGQPVNWPPENVKKLLPRELVSTPSLFPTNPPVGGKVMRLSGI